MKDTTTLTPGSHGFALTFKDGFVLSVQYGVGNYCGNQDLVGAHDSAHGDLVETSTMEIAIMDSRGGFVVLPYDVAGWVPVACLAGLIEAVEAHDWERICLLCGEVNEPDYTKFPEKGVDYA